MGVDIERIAGDERITEFANIVSEAVSDAENTGLEMDTICSILACITADYARLNYSREYVATLGSLMLKRCDEPLPEVYHQAKG